MTMHIPEKFARLVRAIVGMPADPGRPPRYDRMARYEATVVTCASDGSTCDVRPVDPRITPQKLVRVRSGIPGAQAVVAPGALVLLGWKGGDPAQPFCEPSWDSATVTKLILNGQLVILGAESGADFVALAQKVDSLNTALRAAITAAKTAVTPMDGGLAAFTAFDLALKPPALTYTWPTSVAAAQTKAK